MKKIIVILALVLVGCKAPKTNTYTITVVTGSEPLGQVVNVEIKEVDKDSITLYLSNPTAEPFTFSQYYTLEYYENNQAQPIPTPDGHVVEDIAYILEPQQVVAYEIGWNKTYGSLEKGVYLMTISLYSHMGMEHIFTLSFEV